jgi:hypothetical protein
MVSAKEQVDLRRDLEQRCKELTWAIHAAALNTPGVFLDERRKKAPLSVVVPSLEPEARVLAAAGLSRGHLDSWSLRGAPPAPQRVREAAAKLESVARHGRTQVGVFLGQLGRRLDARVTLVATVCGLGRPHERIGGIVADGYVLALRRTCQTVAELVAAPDRSVNIDVHVLERDVRRDSGPVTGEPLSPTYVLRIADDGVRRAKVKGVSVSSRPHVYPWNPQTSAMLVLADHAANRFGKALAASGCDDLDAFRARIVAEVGVDARVADEPGRGDGLAHLGRGVAGAPFWAGRLPPGRER